MVKCAGCGFLCIRQYDEVFREADSNYRGVTNIGVTGQAGVAPLCFVLAYDLRREFSREPESNNDPVSAVNNVIQRERDCPRFTEWHQGFPPKEHKEMLFDLERKKLELQEKAAERLDVERRERENRRFQLFNTFVSAIAGAIITAAVGGAVAWVTTAKAVPSAPLMPHAASQP